jgi:hypothetical protein
MKIEVILLLNKAKDKLNGSAFAERKRPGSVNCPA